MSRVRAKLAPWRLVVATIPVSPIVPLREQFGKQTALVMTLSNLDPYGLSYTHFLCLWSWSQSLHAVY